MALIGGLAAGPLGAVGAGAVGGAVKPLLSRIGQGFRDRDEASAVGAGHAEEDPDRMSSVPEAERDGSGTESAPARAVLLPDLVAFAAHVAEVCGVSELVRAEHLKFRVESGPVHRKKDGSLPDPEPAFLNSRFPEDLARVAASSDEYGAALAEYLRDPASIDPQLRCDVREDVFAGLYGVQPIATPPGRWPAPNAHPLALSQQFAVNEIIAELKDGAGLFSVNGPPGTGKSTLLRDLVAAIVVRRAMKLAELPNPQAAFRGTRTWTAEGRTYTVHLPLSALTGFEIVVASSNNGAVENITTELPSLEAIGPEWRAEASYFLEQATALLDGDPAWGAVAAPLGNAEKRRAFVQRFWWGERAGTGLQRLLQNLEQGGALHDPPAAERFSGGRPSNGPAAVAPGTPPTPTAWREAVRRFRAAVVSEEKLRRERQEVFRSLAILDISDRRTAEAKAEELEQRWLTAQRLHQEADTQAGSAHIAAGYAEAAIHAHAQARPRGLRAWGGARVRAWQEQHHLLNATHARRYHEWSALYDAARIAATQAEAAGRAADEARQEAARIAAEENAAKRLVAWGRQQWPTWFPGTMDEWERLADEEREISSPWADPDWVCARTRVFLAALDLHRAFVAGAAGTVRRNLLHLIKTLKREPDAPPPDAELAAWQTLFLVVPVVSTTFASCGRLFESLGTQALGWVLVDEAGQATPQAAVGALWRARRAVLVGDPLQLEPVIQVPEGVQELLLGCYDVKPEWLPSRGSAQALADRVNRWGTTVPTCGPDGEAKPVWVGAPLRVHRRCEEPMFSISNDIAYDGLMVYGTAEASFPGHDRAPYPESCWVDVTSDDAEGKWIPAEGQALARILEKLHRENGVELARIRVLSPFRDVVAGCRRTVRRLDWTGTPPPGISNYRAQVNEFIEGAIGTVHTMQGKEADVVILVLGTHPRRGAKARDWAAQSPNLLNVAVSRAKRRLFVVGNREHWSKVAYFQDLANELRHRRWSPPRT